MIERSARLSTGIGGLDDILHGGLISRRAYLVRGQPGTGKTTLGLHFLSAGRDQKEPVLLISFEAPEAQLRRDAEAQDFDLNGVTFLDLSPTPDTFAREQTYDFFSPAEVERDPVTRRIVEQVKELQPKRVFVDAITTFRFLAPDDFQFRKQTLSFMRFLVDQGATVILSSEVNPSTPDSDLQFLSSGVITLSRTAEERLINRTVSVEKFRGSDFHDGQHTVRLTRQGMEVSQRLLPEAHMAEFAMDRIPFGVAGLDALLHGGIERGTVTIITGPTGVGKTTAGTQFMKEAARRGERSVLYSFEEQKETILQRCEAVDIPAREMIERGTLSIVQVEPLRTTADEFACWIRHEVEAEGTTVVMLDSISGYRLTLLGEELMTQLYALCKYLRNMGVTTLLANEIERITGDFRVTEMGISFLADNVLFLRYIETDGRIRKAIGILKKRVSDFEKTLREIRITAEGIQVGEPLVELRGILTGTPRSIDAGR